MAIAMPKGVFWRTWRRAHNRLQDWRAWSVGACNRDTWDPVKRSYSGGYAHWRCMKAKRHVGPHRYINYVWRGPGHPVQFDPIPVRGAREIADDQIRILPFMHVTRNRHLIAPMARERQLRHRAEDNLARYRAERMGS